MRNLKEIKSNKNLYIKEEGDDGFIGFYCDPLNNKRYRVIFSYGGGWEHASVSTKNKSPSWDIMCRIKDLFWEEDECCVEYHPAKKDYVNTHDYCLHIWKPIKAKLPTPPKEFV